MISSVYVHIPFCNNICSYCDFCKSLYNEDLALQYLIALQNEISINFEDEKLKTLYVGGGTPSALSVPLLKKLFNILSVFKFREEYEFTFECNIDDIRPELLVILKKCGVNRLSIGVQSFNKKKLDFLERDHNFEEAQSKIALCREYEFNNINVDLIYATPSETVSVLKSDIDKILKLNVEHISTYSLIIEENTKLKIKETEYIDQDLDEKMYKTIIKNLTKNKYNHYEVSNFAKPGFESVHNTVYWDNEQYYGFGLGASGYIRGTRYENTHGLPTYIKGSHVWEKEKLEIKQTMDYELMLGFRKNTGISISEFELKYKTSIFDAYDLDELISGKYIIIKGDNLIINPKHIYIMNEILVKIF